jgi:hypothetical protein
VEEASGAVSTSEERSVALGALPSGELGVPQDAAGAARLMEPQTPFPLGVNGLEWFFLWADMPRLAHRSVRLSVCPFGPKSSCMRVICFNYPASGSYSPCHISSPVWPHGAMQASPWLPEHWPFFSTTSPRCACCRLFHGLWGFHLLVLLLLPKLLSQSGEAVLRLRRASGAPSFRHRRSDAGSTQRARGDSPALRLMRVIPPLACVMSQPVVQQVSRDAFTFCHVNT